MGCVDLRYVAHYSREWYGHSVIKDRGGSMKRRLYEDDDARGVLAEHVGKLVDILARLDAAGTISDLDLPGLRLHPLRGELSGLWAVTVRANWRVVFRMDAPNVFDVD